MTPSSEAATCCRVSVFSFAQIPLALHLGFVLSDRVEVDADQFDRERKDVAMARTTRPTPIWTFRRKGCRSKKVNKAGDVVIRVSLSGKIAPEEHAAVVNRGRRDRLSVKKPGCDVAAVPSPVGVLAGRFREVLRTIRESRAELPSGSTCFTPGRQGAR